MHKPVWIHGAFQLVNALKIHLYGLAAQPCSVSASQDEKEFYLVCYATRGMAAGGLLGSIIIVCVLQGGEGEARPERRPHGWGPQTNDALHFPSSSQTLPTVCQGPQGAPQDLREWTWKVLSDRRVPLHRGKRDQESSRLRQSLGEGHVPTKGKENSAVSFALKHSLVINVHSKCAEQTPRHSSICGGCLLPHKLGSK